jgi:hypothetical protein
LNDELHFTKKATQKGGFQIFKASNPYRFIFFNSFTAKSAALAVSAMYVNDGFTQDADTMAAPSVTNTFGAPHTWLLAFKTEVLASLPILAVPIS